MKKKDAILVLFSYFDIYKSIKNRYSEEYRILILGKDFYIEGVEEMSKDFFDEIILINDLNDFIELKNTITELQKKFNIKFIFSRFEKYIEIGSKIKKEFGLYDVDDEFSIIMRDKYFMRQKCLDTKLKCPNFKLVFNEEDIINNCELGKKYVLKPRKLFGASGIQIINISNRNLNLNLNKNEFLKEGMLLEEFILGEEYRLDFIVAEEKLCFLLLGKYYTRPLESRDSQKGNYRIYQNKKDKIYIFFQDYVLNLIKNWNIKTGIYHLEVYLNNKNEVFFGEIAARLGGCHLDIIYKDFFNFDIGEKIIDNELGNLKPFSIPEKKSYIGEILLDYSPGKIINISSKEDFKNINSLKHFKLKYKVGDILPENHGSTKRSGFCLLENKDKGILENELKTVLNNFKLEVSDV